MKINANIHFGHHGQYVIVKHKFGNILINSQYGILYS